MPEIQRLALLPFSAASMYDLVRDVPRYPEFLSWCVAATVHEESTEWQVASLRVRLGGLETVFMTENRLAVGQSLEMRLLDGPFSRLEGDWRFVPLGENGCRVSLKLRFEFNRRWLSVAFQRGFAHIADRLVDDFCRRAEGVLGGAQDEAIAAETTPDRAPGSEPDAGQAS